MPPTWLDQVIETVIGTGDPQVIAQVVANSPRFLDAIKRGLANKPRPGIVGPTPAQIIAQELRAEMTAV
jgi:hypothetical protein